MLRLLTEAPTDLGKRGEITKHSPALDRMTGDTADLRLYASNDGKRTYLRVWETTLTGDKSPKSEGARWYAIEEPAPLPEKDVTTSKR